MVAASLFVGNALSGGYVPYMGMIAAGLCLLALFMPFLSEYNILHRGFSKIGDNFKSLMGGQDHHQGDVEILLPGESHLHVRDFEKPTTKTLPIGMIILLVLSTLLLGTDAVTYYFVEEGLKPDKGPISNF